MNHDVDCENCVYNTNEQILCKHPESNTHGFEHLINDGTCFKAKIKVI